MPSAAAGARNRDPRTSDPCFCVCILVFVLYCLFLIWLQYQERNGLTEGSCSPAYREEVGQGESLAMGVSGSKGQKLFVSVLQRLLAERGLHVKESSAAEFYRFLLQVSPWFPEEGGLNLEDWKKVGREMRRYTAEHGSESIPRQAYPIWLQMREILTEQSDLVLLHAEARSEGEGESRGLLLEGLKGKTYGTADITDRYDTKDLVEAVEKNWKSQFMTFHMMRKKSGGKRKRRKRKGDKDYQVELGLRHQDPD